MNSRIFFFFKNTCCLLFSVLFSLLCLIFCEHIYIHNKIFILNLLCYFFDWQSISDNVNTRVTPCTTWVSGCVDASSIIVLFFLCKCVRNIHWKQIRGDLRLQWFPVAPLVL